MRNREGRGGSLELGTGRVEAFSDGVMAVIITIMALELRAPEGATLEAVRGRLPGLLVYLLSFVIIGIYWNNHHHLLRAAERVSGAAMWANLFLLFCLSLIPVHGPDSAVAAAIGSDRKGYASLALYAAGVGLAFVSPWIAYGCYVAVAVIWFIPDRRFTSF
jgi:uncharacterized membrane protein